MDLLAVRNLVESRALKLMYGDGVDGTISHVIATFLARDLYCTTYTSSAGVGTDGYRIFATESITISSGAKLFNNGGFGGDASASTGGGAGGSAGRGSIGIQPLPGAKGGSVISISGGPGIGGNDILCDVSQNKGTKGGKGGQGYFSCGPTGPPAGVPGAAGDSNNESYWPYRQLQYISDWFGSLSNPRSGIPGGSGGGGSGRLVAGRPTGGGGGGSGGPGGCIFLCAPVITVASGGELEVKAGGGGDGADAAAGSFGGGGGAGGGGNGGTIILVYEELITGGTFDRGGGGAGAIGLGDGCGDNGGSVTAPIGQAGRLLKVDLTKLTITAS